MTLASAIACAPAVYAQPHATSPSGDPLSDASARERAIELLHELSRGSNAQVRANAVEALGVSPARVSAVVGDRLLDANEGVRSVALMVAGRLRLSEHADRVELMLSDPSPFARASAVYALRRCGADQDPTVLSSLLLEHDDPRVRAHAAFILGELGEASALGPLRQASADPMPRANPSAVRLLKLQIAEAMIKLGDEGQLSVVRAALYPARPDELEAAALAVQILGEVEDRGAIDQLITLSKSPAETDRAMPAEVRLAAAGALAKLGHREGAFIADEFARHVSAVLRAQAAAVYGEIGREEALAPAAALLEDRSDMVRAAAAGAVLRITEGRGRRATAGDRGG